MRQLEPQDVYCQSLVTCGQVRLMGLKPRTKLYHYLSLAAFLAWVEIGCLTMRQVTLWQDGWEQPFRQIRLTAEPDNERVRHHYDGAYGHSWTRNHESDAMWRLYSPEKRGLRIATSADHFALIGGIAEAVLAPVWYSNEPVIKILEHDDKFPGPGYVDSFVKRTAFRHEREVRLVVNLDHCLPGVQASQGALRLTVDPVLFMTDVAVDPRADEWYVDAVRHYCARAGFTRLPERSGLYSEDPLDAGLFPVTRRYL